jgi:hypothetical protein|tara:strand:+ start:305 stop:559 length:255 start_codon:yes stop_codon:yes gene_type:complete
MTLEQEWTNKIKKNLIGRKITNVIYIPLKEVKDNYWSQRPIAIELDDGNWIYPTQDDEGNDGGSMFTTYKDLPIIPVLQEEDGE